MKNYPGLNPAEPTFPLHYFTKNVYLIGTEPVSARSQVRFLPGDPNDPQ